MISIVIPALNEAAALPNLLSHLRERSGGYVKEIIISDGNSSDSTVAAAEEAGAIVVRNQERGRACQMNSGAGAASAEVLYFLHADSLPPAFFDSMIMEALKDPGTHAGCFRLRFDHSHWFLKINAWFTRFDIDAIRFGDQSLFIRRDSFYRIGGFSEDHVLLEDQEIVRRARSLGNFVILKGYITTSARKYLKNGIVRLQMIYFYIYTLYRLGYSQQELVNRYRRLIS